MPLGIDRKMCGDQFGKFLRQVAPHAEISRERRLRGVDIKARAKSEIIGAGRITRHAFAAWAGIGRHKNQTQFGACLAILALFGDVGVGTGQARQIPDDRELRAVLMRGDKHRKGHARSGFAAGVLVNALHTTVGSIEGNGFDGHDRSVPAPPRFATSNVSSFQITRAENNGKTASFRSQSATSLSVKFPTQTNSVVTPPSSGTGTVVRNSPDRFDRTTALSVTSMSQTKCSDAVVVRASRVFPRLRSGPSRPESSGPASA